MTFETKARDLIEDYGLGNPESITDKKITELQKKAMKCIGGVGDSYEVMASAVLLGEALKHERRKNK